MYQGLTLEEMARKVQRQAARKDDLLVDTRDLTLLNGSELHVGEGSIGGTVGEYEVGKIAHRQIAARLGIPAKFADALRDDENQQVKRLLDTNVNTLFRERPETRMIRTYSATADEPSSARAFLSDSYRRRDNDELLAHVLPILGEIDDVQIASTGITDSAFYLKAVAPKVQGEVKAGDVVQAGVIIRNSEVDHGSLSIAPFFYRLWCSNGCGIDEVQRHYHVGAHVTAGEDARVFSDETLRKDDAAFFAKIGDTVQAAVDQTRFNDLVLKLREAATGETIANPPKAVERLVKTFSLNETEGGSILKHLSEGGDMSAYGMLNAVTRTSQDAEQYERATELELLGGKVLAMAGTRDWEEIAA